MTNANFATEASLLTQNTLMLQTHIRSSYSSCNKSGVKKIYVNFDTRFSTDIGSGGGSDLANYNFVLPIRLTNIKSMSVTNVEVPISYFNISSNMGNNTFRINNIDAEIITPIIIPDGQYTLNQLQTVINNLLPPDVRFSINTNGQSVFSVNGISDYYIEFYTDSMVDNDKNDPKFKLGWMLGFRYVAYPLKNYTSLVSECICNLNGSRYLYLVVDEFQNGKENTFNSLVSSSMLKKNILARVTPSYVNYPYGSVLPANMANGYLRSDTRTYKGKVDIQRLNVQLVNEIGKVICLNGGYIMFCLELEVHDT